MKLINTLIFALFAMTVASVFAADAVKTTRFGTAEVSSNYHTADTGVAILTLVAQVSETNNSLRGLKNADQRRLSKLGQLVYQCKLMIYQSDSNTQVTNKKPPDLIARNYSLFTGVDLPLSDEERLGIQVQALQTVDDSSLFTATLGNSKVLTTKWETLDEGSAINLNQFDINVLNETDLIKTSESIEIAARFPIFQMEKPVTQWRYHFNLKDFKRAIQHVDENCTAARFKAIINL